MSTPVKMVTIPDRRHATKERRVSVSTSLPIDAVKLVIFQQPVGAASGSPLGTQPVVYITNTEGTVAFTSTLAVTASMVNPTGTLSGTLTVTAVHGVAAFTDLVVTGGSGTATLKFAAPGLVTVQAQGATITGTGATPYINEDFSTYSSTDNLLANPNKWFDAGGYDRIGTAGGADDMTGAAVANAHGVGTYGKIQLDTTVGYGSSTKSMRYDWLDRTPQGGDPILQNGYFTSFYITRAFNIGSDSATWTDPQSPLEVWTEEVRKWGPGWTVSPGAAWAAQTQGNPDWKQFLEAGPNYSDRFEYTMQSTAWTSGPNGNHSNLTNVLPSAVLDGNWHTFRYHTKVGNGTAISKFWIDGTVMDSQTTATETNSKITLFVMGSNMNVGQDHNQSSWLGRFRIYLTDPGW